MSAAIKDYIIDQGSTFERFFAIKNPIITYDANTTSGSAIVSGLNWTGTLSAGMQVSGLGIPSGTTILSITDLNTIVLSANATATNTATPLSFTLGGYVDITSLDFRGQLRDTVDSLEIGANLSFTKDTVNRTVRVFMSAASTALLNASDYNYDIEMYAPLDATVVKIFKGVFTINPEVTR